MRLKRPYLLGIALPALVAAGAAHAQTTPASPSNDDGAATTQPQTGETSAPSSTGGIGDIIVTARRRSENLQRVPVSVTALDDKALESHSVVNISDIGSLSPGLAFHASSYGVLGLNVQIRGQMPTDLDLTQTPSIGVYVDDIYQGSTIGLSVLDLSDAASVEVLKGPQGTLYGRNTTGGALKITTKLPDLDEVEGIARVGYGNQDNIRAYGAISIPLAKGALAVRISANYQDNSGYGEDTLSHNRIGDVNIKGVQGALRAKFSDKFEAVLRGSWSKARSGGMLYSLSYVVPGGGLNTITAFQTGAGLTPAGMAAALANLNTNYLYQSGLDRQYNGPLGQSVEQYEGSLTLTYNVSDALTLKSISALQQYANHMSGDNDGTPFRTVDGNFENIFSDQFTEELQALGSIGDGRLQYTLGYYYYRRRGHEFTFADVLYPLLGLQVRNDASLVGVSNSGYGQVTFKLLPSLRITGGIRYTSETNDLVSRNKTSSPAGITCNVPPSLAVGGCQAFFSHSDADWSYTVGADFDAAKDVLLYAKTSRSFKAGGVNMRGTVDGGFNPFLPERVTDYEIGAKTEFWDRRIRFNVAAYRAIYDNIQRTVLVPGVGSAPATAVQNAASAKITGLEAELTLRPIPALTLSASGAYTDAKYDRYSDPVTGADLSYRVFAGVPKWQGNLSATFTQPVSIGTISATGDLSYTSKVNYDSDNNLAPSAALPFGTQPYTSQGAYALVNARLALDIEKIDVTVALWARNLLDKRYFSGAKDYSGTLGMANEIVGAPRTFGVELTKRF